MRRQFHRFALVLWTALSVSGSPLLGQEAPCFTADDCDALRLLIVRDVTPACPAGTSSTCSGTDPFRHITYRVYLRYTVDNSTPDSLLTFALAHTSLNARVQFGAYSGTSHIDYAASYSCFTAGPGAAWDLDDKVIWDGKKDGEIALDFRNETSGPVLDCGASDARILFSPDVPANAEPCPTGKKCAYAYLFPVVVQARPGDTIRLNCVGLDYEPIGSSGTPCSPASCAVNTNNNGQNGIFPYAIPLAPVPSGDNADIEVRLTNPWDSPDVDNAEAIALEIENTGANSITVDYLEFMVKIAVGVAIPDPLFASPFGPPLSVREVYTGGSNYEYYVQYALSIPLGLTLSPNTPVYLDTLTIGPPMPFNQFWEGQISLVDEARSRVRSEEECSRLNLSDTVKNLESTGGTLPCDTLIPEGVRYTIRGVPDTTGGCEPPKVQMGFYGVGLSDPVELVFDGFVVRVAFDLGGSLEISDVNFVNGWTCTGSCPNDCFTVGITNDNELTISMCETSNLSLNSSNGYEAFLEVEFEGIGCVNSAELLGLWYLKDDALPPCVPVYDDAYEGLPVCGGQASGRLAFWINDEGLEDATVYLNAIHGGSCDTTTCPKDSILTNIDGEYVLCPCVECDSFVVTPYRNNDPLNGVSTFDLVLLNKHILGVEPFTNPYQFIAADGNNSRSISTFDIVEFRKLILGIYTSLPNNTSWRFVHADYSFSNPPNPFIDIPPFPETGKVPPLVNDFVAIKVGDVNGNAVVNGNSRPGPGHPALTVAWPQAVSKYGKTITVPVQYTGTEPVQALQLGLRFDPAALRLLSPSKGDLAGVAEGNFGLVRAGEGEIRWLWLPDGTEPEQYVLPGVTLFYLTFELRTPLPESGLPMWTDDVLLKGLAWGPDDTEYSLVQTSAAERQNESALPTAPLEARVLPNPTSSGTVHYSVTASQAGPGRIALFDAFGKLVFLRKVDLAAGEQQFPAPEAASIPPGVYIWRVYAGGQKISGHLIKQ